MGYYFTNTFKTALAANQALMAGATIKAAFFFGAPALDEDPAANAARYGSYDTMAEYTGVLGWIESQGSGYQPAETLVVNTRDVGNSRYVIFGQFPALPGFSSGLSDQQHQAVAFIFQGSLGGVTNPVIFVTDTLFSPPLVLGAGDAITAQPDTTLGASSNRWLFAWPTNVPSPNPTVGPLVLLKGAPNFEVSHAVHVWLHPQRVNFIANPSFESGTAPLSHWRSNGTGSSVTHPLMPDGSPVLAESGLKAGKFQGTAPVIVESNTWPGLSQDEWTINLMAMGNGRLKVALLWWEEDYTSTASDWGDDQEWLLIPGSYIHVQALRFTPQAAALQLRIEIQGTAVWLDKCLVEPQYLLDWPYFDGDSLYGARDDYSWYGGENRKGKTYSLWYNHKRAVGGRLFAAPVEGPVVTSEDMEDHGLVYEWVPAGQAVTPHWDVLFEGDLQHPVSDVAGTAVHPYKVDDLDLLGVTNPWT